jgi:hypothetical protein
LWVMIRGRRGFDMHRSYSVEPVSVSCFGLGSPLAHVRAKSIGIDSQKYEVAAASEHDLGYALELRRIRAMDESLFPERIGRVRP